MNVPDPARKLTLKERQRYRSRLRAVGLNQARAARLINRSPAVLSRWILGGFQSGILRGQLDALLARVEREHALARSDGDSSPPRVERARVLGEARARPAAADLD